MAISTINVATLDGTNGFRIDGEGVDFFSGVSVSSAGDINGDGLDDVMVGALRSYYFSYHDGRSYVVFGQNSGFDAVIDLASLDGTDGFRMIESRAPYLVSDAGDVNGDGFDDALIGVEGSYGVYNSSEGAAYVVFGKAGGFAADLDLSTLDGKNGFSMDGTGKVNVTVSSAGDVNGDGVDDVIVGARTASYVVFGKTSGFDAGLDLSGLDGNDGFRLEGGGAEVSGAGDINGDGFDDVMVTVGADAYGADQNTGYVVFGKASGFNSTLDLASLDGSDGFSFSDGKSNPQPNSVSNIGDINGDGLDDIVFGTQAFYDEASHTDYESAMYVLFGRTAGFSSEVDLSHLDGSNGFRIDGAESEQYYGVSVDGAGDVNGDGFDDVIVGTDQTAYVVFGKASSFDATLDLTMLTSEMGFTVTAIPGRTFFSSVSSAGDVNNDGFDDLIIGAPFDNLEHFEGSSYVVFGRSDFGNGGLPEILGTPEDDQLKGTSAAELFKAGDGNDRMIGRGGADEFHGEAGNDYIQVLDLGFGLVDGGSGNDVLHTDGADLNLDLTDYLDKIQGIEAICLYGRGDNTLTLTGAELKQLSDTTNTLKVHGNVGDQVILEGNWVDGGSQGFYHTYTQDDAVLLVGMNMTAVVG
ncbi:MAG: FG-GAP repeat protein [Nitrosomonas sp.]|nr:FG-GAP repeat protein [Nitrosomonas sp.]